jgi:hypothetical protein
MVFNKGEKLKATESWRMNGKYSEEVDKFNCLGVTMESTGGWNKLKRGIKLNDIKLLQL